MKKIHATRLFAAMLLAAPFIAHADNQIDFEGEVTDNTCTVVGNANGDQQVPLAKINAADLNRLGSLAAGTFKISVTGCPATVATAQPYFQSLGSAVTVNFVNGNLKNIASASPATGVEVQMFNATTTTTGVLLNEGVGAQNVDVAPVSGGNATSVFTLRYVKDGTATPGLFSTGLLYAMTYN